MKIGTKIKAILNMGATRNGVVSEGAFKLRKEHIWITIMTDNGPLEIWVNRNKISKPQTNLYKYVLNE